MVQTHNFTLISLYVYFVKYADLYSHTWLRINAGVAVSPRCGRRVPLQRSPSDILVFVLSAPRGTSVPAGYWSRSSVVSPVIRSASPPCEAV